jgi:predicted PurR-regulated permease PerM
MTSSISQIIKKLLLLFLLISGVYYGRSLLMPITIAAILAMLFLPLCRTLERTIPRIIAAVICLLVLLLVVSGIGALLGWQILELTRDIHILKQSALRSIDILQDFINKNTGISIQSQLEVLKGQQSFLAQGVQNLASSITSYFTYFVLIIVYIFFMLYYRNHIRMFMISFSPGSKNEMDKLIRTISRVSQQYLWGLFKMIVCLWIMYGIGFSIVGIKNALFFAILCGLLEIVPFIGNLTGTLITILVTIIHGGSFAMLTGLLATYGIVQFIQGWVLEPLIVGSQVKINPLFTIIALVIGELLWGIPGIFLAIPLMAMFKVTCDYIEPLKPYGLLIGEVKRNEENHIIS